MNMHGRTVQGGRRRSAPGKLQHIGCLGTTAPIDGAREATASTVAPEGSREKV